MVHQETTLDLQPLNILIGPNGSGKSAFFDGLVNFSMIARGNLREAFGAYPYSFRATLHHGAMRISKIGYALQLSRTSAETEVVDYEIQFAQQGNDETNRFAISSETLSYGASNPRVVFNRNTPELFRGYNELELEGDRAVLSSVRRAHASGPVPKDIDSLVVYCAQQVSRFNRFRLEPYLLSQPSAIPDVSVAASTDESQMPISTFTPHLGYRGDNLAGTLFFLSETKAPQLERIRQLIRDVEPAFADFEFNTVGPDRVGFSIAFKDVRKIVPAVRLSSGMLSYLGLIVLVSTPNRPSVLMIEEPENGLTAQAIKTFFGAVRDLAFDEAPNRSQILISTHSPVLFSEAWNTQGHEIIHQFKIEDGKVVVGEVSEERLKGRGIHLGKVGNRPHMGVNNAAEIMSGYLA